MKKLFSGDDRGETLVESLTSIMFIGLAVLGIIGAVGVASFHSSIYERKSQAAAELRNKAESLSYVPCGTPADYQSQAAGMEVTKILYWNGSSYVATCSSPDGGAQKLSLKLDVAAAGSSTPASSTLEVVVRR